MIYPTRRAVWLLAAGAPVTLVIALVAPALWVAGPVWILAVAALLGLDGALAPARGAAAFELQAPDALGAPDGEGEAALRVTLTARRTPARVEAALQTNARLAASPARTSADLLAGAPARAVFHLSAARRGEGRVERAWARWTGPLGLLYVQASVALDHVVHITPDLAAVREEAMRLFARNAVTGRKTRPDTGEGFEFQALREYAPGMDLRTVDWKQSARHGVVLAKEFRVERNHPVMLAIDSGRLMGEPVEGAPRLDRALNAALLIAYVALTMGDRVGLAAFDGHARTVGKPVAGRAAFRTLTRLASGIDYSTEETNFTLGLSAIGAALDRRALVVIFTDFADPTSAQLMLESAARLSQRHLLLFVLFEDAELEGVRRGAPMDPADVSRAVTADVLLREREIVVARLRRMGAEVLEAPANALGAGLIDRYLNLKRLDRL